MSSHGAVPILIETRSWDISGRINRIVACSASFVPPPGYRCVYRGGHHAVYCNGETHIATRGGGFTALEQPRRVPNLRPGRCDCDDHWVRP